MCRRLKLIAEGYVKPSRLNCCYPTVNENCLPSLNVPGNNTTPLVRDANTKVFYERLIFI